MPRLLKTLRFFSLLIETRRSPLAATAQTTNAAINGTVIDSTGAAISGATVTVTNTTAPHHVRYNEREFTHLLSTFSYKYPQIRTNEGKLASP